jgi:hypothetical protein
LALSDWIGRNFAFDVKENRNLRGKKFKHVPGKTEDYRGYCTKKTRKKTRNEVWKNVDYAML